MVEQIQAMCTANGTTIKALEKALGLGNGTIRRWDENSPSIAKVLQVANYFNVSIECFLSDEDIKKETTPENGNGLKINLIKEVMKLHDDQVAVVAAVVAGLQSKPEL